MRLWLVGEDDALDIVAELSRHLTYFQVARTDEPPADLGADDHVVVTPALADGWSAASLTVVLPSEADGDSPGARAIDAAGQLVAALRARRRTAS